MKRAHVKANKAKRFFSFKRKYLCIPYFAFLLIFVIIPILIILVYAFTASTEDGVIYFDPSFPALVSFFTSPTKANILVTSLFIGVLNTLICLLIGYPIAYLLANSRFNKNKILYLLFIMPMWINFVLRTGATRDVLVYIYNAIGTSQGDHPYLSTMIGLVYNYLPFTILPLYTTMIKLDKAQLEAASDLGATPVQAFIHSVIPQSVPGIVSAAEMVFMPTLSSYVISDTLSEGKITLFGNIIQLNFSQSMWNEGSFMAFIMLVLVFLTMLISRRFDKGERMERRANLW